jgi:hypothetical protein
MHSLPLETFPEPINLVFVAERFFISSMVPEGFRPKQEWEYMSDLSCGLPHFVPIQQHQKS